MKASLYLEENTVLLVDGNSTWPIGSSLLWETWSKLLSKVSHEEVKREFTIASAYGITPASPIWALFYSQDYTNPVLDKEPPSSYEAKEGNVIVCGSVWVNTLNPFNLEVELPIIKKLKGELEKKWLAQHEQEQAERKALLTSIIESNELLVLDKKNTDDMFFWRVLIKIGKEVVTELEANTFLDLYKPKKWWM